MRQPRLHPLRSATWVVVIAVAAISCADNGSATKATPASTTRPASAAAREIAATGDLSATPPALSAERPGTLLRFQRITTPIAGSTAGPSTLWRVMYVSSDDAGAPVAVTGLVRVPDGRAPGAGWPVISWAHGTTGTADRCAPFEDHIGAVGAQRLQVPTRTDPRNSRTDYDDVEGFRAH